MYPYCNMQYRCQPLIKPKPGPTGSTGPSGPGGTPLVFAGNVPFGTFSCPMSIITKIPINTLYGLPVVNNSITLIQDGYYYIDFDINFLSQAGPGAGTFSILSSGISILNKSAIGAGLSFPDPPFYFLSNISTTLPLLTNTVLSFGYEPIGDDALIPEYNFSTNGAITILKVADL